MERYFTVTQFAKEVGVTPPTIRAWVKSGYLKNVRQRSNDLGLTWYAIPESNLKLPEIVARMALREANGSQGWFLMGSGKPTTLEDAKRQYAIHQQQLQKQRKVFCSYDELQQEFSTDISYGDLAKKYGVSRQRMHQIYMKYFENFLGDSKQRRKRREAADQARARVESMKRIPKLNALRLVCESLGLTIEPTALVRLQRRASDYYVYINGYKCKVQASIIARPANPSGHHGYHRFNVTRRTLEGIDFNIWIAGDKDEKYFIIPTDLLRVRYRPGKERMTFYLPDGNYPVYNNQYPQMTYWDYHNRWDLLGAKL